MKEEVSDEPPLCVKSEPEGTTSPPPSPPRQPGRAKRAKLVVRLDFKVIFAFGASCLVLTARLCL